MALSVVGESALAGAELSSLGRLEDGERGPPATFGFCWVVNKSFMVLPVCLRFLSAGLEDIGRLGIVDDAIRKCDD